MRFHYSVTGFGEFPLDMLRYDRAWPASQDAVAKISERRSQRTVEINGTTDPRVGRWNSFGWQVGKVVKSK